MWLFVRASSGHFGAAVSALTLYVAAAVTLHSDTNNTSGTSRNQHLYFGR